MVDGDLERLVAQTKKLSKLHDPLNKEELYSFVVKPKRFLVKRLIESIQEFNDYPTVYLGSVSGYDALKLWLEGKREMKKYSSFNASMFSRVWKNTSNKGTRPDNFGYEAYVLLDMYAKENWKPLIDSLFGSD